MNTKLVSVIMSTLNTNSIFLEQAIDSILNQTYTNFEFIIVVDGGNDDELINKKYKDDRIKVIKHKQSQGLPKSLNEAIKNSKGEYIARMDSDDISLPNRLFNQVKYMETHNEIDITSTYYEEFGQSNKIVKPKFITKDEVRCKLFFINTIAHPSVMFRKKSIEKYKLYYDEQYTYSQDFELWNRNLNVNIEIIPSVELKYRIHSDQVSSLKKEKQTMFYSEILKRNLKKIEIDDSYVTDMLILNGRIKNKDYSKIYKFIQKVIAQNKKLNVYNHELLENLLKRQYVIFCIKNKCVFNLKFIQNIRYLF